MCINTEERDQTSYDHHMTRIETNQYIAQYRWLNELLLVTNPWGIPKNFSIKAAVFASKNWIGTNCGCDLFQSLRDLKAPKALDSEVKPTLPLLVGASWGEVICACLVTFVAADYMIKSFSNWLNLVQRILTGQVKMACPDKSLSLWMISFNFFKNQTLTSSLKQCAVQRNSSFGCKPCVMNRDNCKQNRTLLWLMINFRWETKRCSVHSELKVKR